MTTLRIVLVFLIIKFAYQEATAKESEEITISCELSGAPLSDGMVIDYKAKIDTSLAIRNFDVETPTGEPNTYRKEKYKVYVGQLTNHSVVLDVEWKVGKHSMVADFTEAGHHSSFRIFKKNPFDMYDLDDPRTFKPYSAQSYHSYSGLFFKGECK